MFVCWSVIGQDAAEVVGAVHGELERDGRRAAVLRVCAGRAVASQGLLLLRAD